MWIATAAPAQAVLDSLLQTDAAHARAGMAADAAPRRDTAASVALLTQLMGPAAAPAAE
jgi:hypothetical protein